LTGKERQKRRQRDRNRRSVSQSMGHIGFTVEQVDQIHHLLFREVYTASAKDSRSDLVRSFKTSLLG
jgi:phosphate uptake regulator